MRYEELATEHVVIGLAPVADAFSGTVASDVVDATGHQSVSFYVFKGVGATGTSTITVEACDDIVPTNTVAVAFNYRALTGTDINGAQTIATAAGFTTTAGSAQIYTIQVDAQDLASSGYKYCRLKAVEVVDSPVLGGILIVMNQPKYGYSTTDSVID